jgi:hypothetical protein
MNTNTNATTFCDLELGKGARNGNDSQKKVQQSVLGKRKFDKAFDEHTYDDLRYGQHIGKDFFQNNYGNNCSNWQQVLEEGEIYEPKHIREAANVNKSLELDAQEILSWCEYYLANKSLFKI